MHDDTVEDPAGSNTSGNRAFADILSARLSRRDALLGGGALAIAPALPASATAPSTLAFAEIAHANSPTHAVARGYRADILIRWGDAVETGATPFDPLNQTAASQAKQFGYNNDFIGYLPLPHGSHNSDHGLLGINHEYTNADHMFPGIARGKAAEAMTRERTAVELAAHGFSVIEVRKLRGRWQVVQGSRYNRRFPMTTPMRISGPAAGHPKLRTSEDPLGEVVLGTLNNCAGGKTPWGTFLTGEENTNLYFRGDPSKTPYEKVFKRYGFGRTRQTWWGTHFARFDIEKEPNEPHRFGWVVEIDPYDPASRPVKRTALGRFKHEGATCVVNRDGRVVVYSGDDEAGDYIYKFVTEGRFDPKNRAANRDLLDHGTLYVARFEEDGRLIWLPLVHGQGKLTRENGFVTQADVVIEARRAADEVGATKMDRPEDVETNPVTGWVYVNLTNNEGRKPDQLSKANPRGPNDFGHVLELRPPGGRGPDADHAAPEFRWDVFLLAGDPSKPAVGARYHPGTSKDGWFGSPDNMAFDNRGRIWISTDQGAKWEKTGSNDGIWAMDTEGPGRALSRMFFKAPIGAEVCGPEFTPDGRTLFLAIQHPSTDGAGDSNFDKPATRWPDFKPDIPPRPSVVVITKEDGGEIGS